MNAVVAGAVRKWKSAVTISKARTYRAVFRTAQTRKATGWSGFNRYNVLIDHMGRVAIHHFRKSSGETLHRIEVTKLCASRKSV
jgi:hypothetical protein